MKIFSHSRIRSGLQPEAPPSNPQPQTLPESLETSGEDSDEDGWMDCRRCSLRIFKVMIFFGITFLSNFWLQSVFGLIFDANSPIVLLRKFFDICISSRKKLRDIEALEAKLASGEISAPEPEQLEKVSETDLHLSK